MTDEEKKELIEEALEVLNSWGAEDRLAKCNGRDVEDALETLGEDGEDLLYYCLWSELDEEEKREWITMYNDDVNWDDEDDVYQCWEFSCREQNRKIFAQIIEKHKNCY